MGTLAPSRNGHGVRGGEPCKGKYDILKVSRQPLARETRATRESVICFGVAADWVAVSHGRHTRWWAARGVERRAWPAILALFLFDPHPNDKMQQPDCGRNQTRQHQTAVSVA